jgi:hypothetical protein
MPEPKLHKIDVKTTSGHEVNLSGMALAGAGNPSMWERIRRKSFLGFTYDDLFGGGFRTDWIDAVVGVGVAGAIVLLFLWFVSLSHGWAALKFLSAAGMALDIAGVARTVLAIQRAFQRERAGDVVTFGGIFSVVQVPDVPVLMTPAPHTLSQETVTSGPNAAIKPVVESTEAAARVEFHYAKTGMWLLFIGFALQIVATLFG